MRAGKSLLRHAFSHIAGRGRDYGDSAPILSPGSLGDRPAPGGLELATALGLKTRDERLAPQGPADALRTPQPL